MRYVNLSTILMYRLVSTNVMKRFPSYDSLIKVKLMLPNEKERLEHIESIQPHEGTWAPLLWASQLITKGNICFFFQNFVPLQ